jgi:hypothetical protein
MNLDYFPVQPNPENQNEYSEKDREFLEPFDRLNMHFNRAAYSLMRQFPGVEISVVYTDGMKVSAEVELKDTLKKKTKYIEEGKISKDFAEYLSILRQEKDFFNLWGDAALDFYKEHLAAELEYYSSLRQEYLSDVKNENISFQFVLRATSEEAEYHIDQATLDMRKAAKAMCKFCFLKYVIAEKEPYSDITALDENGEPVFIESRSEVERSFTILPIRFEPIYKNPDNGGSLVEG